MSDNDRKHTDMIVNIQQSINLQAAKATTAAAGQALPGRARPSSYREALASHVTSSESSLVSEWLTRAKTNGTVPSNDLSSGSSAATGPSLLMREDLQLLVRGTARTLVDPLRRDEAELVRRINKAIKADVKDLELPDERGPVSSGQVLPSGDVLLQVDSLDQVRQLTQAAAQKDSNWCHAFGESAALKRHAYAVLARGVSCRFDPYGPGARARIIAENTAARINDTTKITHIGWLMSKRQMEEMRPEFAKLVVEFADADAANQAILRGLTVYGRGHDCQLFEGSQRLQQCFHCQGYGHIARFCKRETRCGYCAEPHDTQDCTHPHDRQRAKCGPCVKAGKTKVNHFTFDRECPVRKEQIALLELNRLKGSQLHQPRFADIPFQKPPSIDHDHPLPSESAGAQAQTQAQAQALQPHRKGSGGRSASRSRSAFKKRRTVTADEDEGTEAIDEDLRAHIGTTDQPIENVSDVQVHTDLLNKPQSTRDQPQLTATLRRGRSRRVEGEQEVERSTEHDPRNDQC
ncbi:hypothetical protein N7513_004756 [Penicillium frequentans]|nr:hypothetical protein N7513_004756 [Penicillium glabrum]